MEVIVDGKPGFTPPEVPEDAMGMLAAVSDDLQAKGRAVLAVKADGKTLDPATTAEALGGKPLSAIGRLEIVSEQTSKLVSESLAELESVLPDLAKVCHDLAAVFQGVDPQSGYEPFQQLANIWSHVKGRQALIARALGVSLDTLAIDGKNVGALHRELNEFLVEAMGALESGDLILLGDLLEYELAPRAETEARITALLRERVGG